MPFTLAHAAAALPFQRWHVNRSALVIGTLAPDFEYFIRMKPDDRFGHTPVGAIVLTLPLAVAVLWIFERYVQAAVYSVLPNALRWRLPPPGRFETFRGPREILLAVACIGLGIVTHLFWDLFTHPTGWAYDRWSLLRENVTIPPMWPVPVYKVLQHGSTIIGTGLLTIWFLTWFGNTPAIHRYPFLSARRRAGVLLAVLSVALLAAILRAGSSIESRGAHWIASATGEGICAAVALIWWQLAAYGMFSCEPKSCAASSKRWAPRPDLKAFAG